LRIRQLAETKSRLGGAKSVTTVSAEALAKAEQLTHVVSVIGRFVLMVSLSLSWHFVFSKQ
jgi:hypothetical protein